MALTDLNFADGIKQQQPISSIYIWPQISLVKFVVSFLKLSVEVENQNWIKMVDSRPARELIEERIQILAKEDLVRELKNGSLPRNPEKRFWRVDFSFKGEPFSLHRCLVPVHIMEQPPIREFMDPEAWRELELRMPYDYFGDDKSLENAMLLIVRKSSDVER